MRKIIIFMFPKTAGSKVLHFKWQPNGWGLKSVNGIVGWVVHEIKRDWPACAQNPQIGGRRSKPVWTDVEQFDHRCNRWALAYPSHFVTRFGRLASRDEMMMNLMMTMMMMIFLWCRLSLSRSSLALSDWSPEFPKSATESFSAEEAHNIGNQTAYRSLIAFAYMRRDFWM